MKGIRYAFRNFTALSVKEHLLADRAVGAGAELTPNEVELVRFAADRSDQLKELADRSPGKWAALAPKGADIAAGSNPPSSMSGAAGLEHVSTRPP
jgi:hypothetical protein